jgi:hypothetical protein
VRLDATNRPKEVGVWIKNARKYKAFVIDDIKVFSRSWWTWWEGLQPEWRIAAGRPFSQKVPLGEVSWESLFKSGCNGFFIVVLTISWWLTAVKGNLDDEDFSQAFSDVLWTTDCIISGQSGKRLGDHDSLKPVNAKKQVSCG